MIGKIRPQIFMALFMLSADHGVCDQCGDGRDSHWNCRWTRSLGHEGIRE